LFFLTVILLKTKGCHNQLPEGIGLKEKDPANPFGHYTKDDLLSYYQEVDFNLIKKNSKPSKNLSKKQYKYSHTNYGLLEIVLELVSEQTYEQLLQQYIFKPCRMQQSGVHDFTVENQNGQTYFWWKWMARYHQ